MFGPFLTERCHCRLCRPAKFPQFLMRVCVCALSLAFHFLMTEIRAGDAVIAVWHISLCYLWQHLVHICRYRCWCCLPAGGAHRNNGFSAISCLLLSFSFLQLTFVYFFLHNFCVVALIFRCICAPLVSKSAASGDAVSSATFIGDNLHLFVYVNAVARVSLCVSVCVYIYTCMCVRVVFSCVAC